VICPKNRDGHLIARRARRTGNVFWGCSKYPKCDYTTNFEPLVGFHDADEGPVARKGDAAICLVCGATIEAAPDAIVAGSRLPGGPPDPAALARPARGGRRSGTAGSNGSRGAGSARRTSARTGGAASRNGASRKSPARGSAEPPAGA
jgi:hypothetical protein